MLVYYHNVVQVRLDCFHIYAYQQKSTLVVTKIGFVFLGKWQERKIKKL
jgi:hypothetical protein